MPASGDEQLVRRDHVVLGRAVGRAVVGRELALDGRLADLLYTPRAFRLWLSLHEVAHRVLSVSAANRPTQYEVTYTVAFSVSEGDKELLSNQEVSATRSYSFDERLLLAKEHEESVLREAMARDLADIVMRRLASL